MQHFLSTSHHDVSFYDTRLQKQGRPESRPLSFVPHCPIVFRRLFGCLSLLSLSAVVLPFFLPLSVCRFSSAVSFAAVIPPPFPAPFRPGRTFRTFHPFRKIKKQDSEKSCFYLWLTTVGNLLRSRRTTCGRPVSPEIPPVPAAPGSWSSPPPAVSRRPRTGSDSPSCCRRYRGPHESSATKSSAAATGFR